MALRPSPRYRPGEQVSSIVIWPKMAPFHDLMQPRLTSSLGERASTLSP